MVSMADITINSLRYISEAHYVAHQGQIKLVMFKFLTLCSNCQIMFLTKERGAPSSTSTVFLYDSPQQYQYLVSLLYA